MRNNPDLYFRSPVVWRNLRALWIQSDPNWMTKVLRRRHHEVDWVEFDEFIDALESVHGGDLVPLILPADFGPDD